MRFNLLSKNTVLLATLSLVLASGASAAPSARARKVSTTPSPRITSEENASDFEEENDSPRRADALSLEILGRGLLYSINFDHQLSRAVALGLGFSYWSLSASTPSYSSASVNALLIPLYANFYLVGDVHRFFLTAGADLVFVSASLTSTSNDTIPASGVGVLPVAGAGYELRTGGGFLLRAAPYLVVTSSKVQPQFGLSLGAAF